MTSKYYYITDLWKDEKFRALSIDPKVLWLYLRTSPCTTAVPGLVVGDPALFAEHVGQTFEEFGSSLKELVDLGVVKVARSIGAIWVRDAMVHNPPSTPDDMREWSAAINCLDDDELKNEVARDVIVFLGTGGFGQELLDIFDKNLV